MKKKRKTRGTQHYEGGLQRDIFLSFIATLKV